MRYGLVGGRLGHSYSPGIHAMMGIADYALAECGEEELCRILQRKDFCGLNVTIPYKKTVMPYLESLSEEAARAGAVNTVLNDHGVLRGYNTDILGFEKMLDRSGIRAEGECVLVLGNGGTAGTARDVLVRRGAAKIVTVSRSGPVDYENVYDLCRDARVIVNTTPVGMWPDTDKCPIEPERFPLLSGVIDVIYRPKETRLMSRAREMGVPACGGMRMLVYQAAASEEIWTGRSFKEAELEAILKKTEETAE